GVANIYVGVNNSLCKNSDSKDCGIYAAPLTITTQGATEVLGFAQDRAGNWSNNAVEIFQIDTTPPKTVPTFTGPYSNGMWTGTVTIKLTATDNLSGVKTTYYKLDG